MHSFNSLFCFYENTVTDEDLRGRNVLHYHPTLSYAKLLRDCSTSAPTLSEAVYTHTLANDQV